MLLVNTEFCLLQQPSKVCANISFPTIAGVEALRAALTAPAMLRSAAGKETNVPVIWDSGASILISPDKANFVGPIESAGVMTHLQGLAKGLRISGRGYVLWTFTDDHGMLRLLKLPAYYVPSAQVRLLGTSSLLQTYRGEALTGTDKHLRLSGVAGDTRRGPVTARVNPANNLPTSFAYSYQALQVGDKALTATVNEVVRVN